MSLFDMLIQAASLSRPIGAEVTPVGLFAAVDHVVMAEIGAIVELVVAHRTHVKVVRRHQFVERKIVKVRNCEILRGC